MTEPQADREADEIRRLTQARQQQEQREAERRLRERDQVVDESTDDSYAVKLLCPSLLVGNCVYAKGSTVTLPVARARELVASGGAKPAGALAALALATSPRPAPTAPKPEVVGEQPNARVGSGLFFYRGRTFSPNDGPFYVAGDHFAAAQTEIERARAHGRKPVELARVG